MGLEGAFVQKLTVSGSIIGNNRGLKSFGTKTYDSVQTELINFISV
jgi:hypothetical protein